MRVNRLSLLLLTTLLSGSALPLMAQQAGEGRINDESSLRTDLPMVLVYLPRDAMSQRKDDPNNGLRVLLREGLRDFLGKFRATAFSMVDPQVKLALRQHKVAVADVVEPLKPDLLQKLATVLGARYILTVNGVSDKNGLTTQVRMEEATGPETWRTLLADQITTGTKVGKQRLKWTDMLAVASDSILVRLGLPSHLDATLRPENRTIAARPKNNKKNETKSPSDTSQTAQGNDTTEKSVGSEKTEGGAGAGNKTGEKNTRAAANEKTGDKRIAKQNEKRTDKKGNEKVASNTGSKQGGTNPTRPDNGFSPFTTDGAGAKEPVTTTPNIAPPPNVSRVDYEAQAVRFRQSGDIANVILSLRHAINERPKDTTLRRQLIKAYQERSLFDAALSETGRALELIPEDASLQKLYGDTLLAKGDVPGAMKAYRAAMRLDPADVTVQVAFGDALLADNQFAEAMTAYDTAHKNAPKSPLPHRRMARAMATRAAGDSTQYAASLEQVKQARALIPPTDTETYQEDYVGLMRLMENRLRDMLVELQNLFAAEKQGKGGNELKRSTTDLKERGEAAADYLDKLPPAAGHDVTHAHYQQGAALLLQAVSLFRDYLSKPETRTEEALRGAQVDAARELTAAAKRLSPAKTTPDPARPAPDAAP